MNDEHNTAPITWHPSPSKPRITLPAGATDTHVHVFGPTRKFPYDKNSSFHPGDAPKEQLFTLHQMLGIEYCVIVQSGCHGYDNSVVADAMAAKPGRYLGIALLPPDVETQTLKAMHKSGFRGIRFNYMSHLAPGATVEELRALAPRLADLGWQLVIHMEDKLIGDMAGILADLPVKVVIDHMGRIDATGGMEQKPFQQLLKLLDHKHIWVKVSGSERSSRQDPPFADAIPFARKLVESFPDHVIWGTDWPHPNFRADPPDDGMLVDLLEQIAPDQKSLYRLLVHNPHQLYDFQ